MNLRQQIADMVLALGTVGPLDELWGGLDPRIELADRGRLSDAESPPDTDPKGRRPAA